MTNESLHPRRRWWPKTLAGKAGVIALFAGVLLVIMYGVALRYSAQRLEAAWKLSDEYGLPNDFVELLGPHVPPERNMTVPLDKAAGIAQLFLTQTRAKLKIQEENHLENSAFMAALDGLLDDPKYEAALAEADRLPDYRSPVVVTESLFNLMLGYLQSRRELVRVEQAAARKLTAKGKRDEAVRRMLRISRLTRRWEDKEPYLIGALVNFAIRNVAMEELNLILRGGPLSAAVHDEIDCEMAECETILRIVPRVAHSEKLMCATDYAQMSPLGKTSLLRPFADNDRAYMIEYLHRWVKTTEKPFYEVKKESEALDDEIKRVAADPLGRIMHLGAVMMTPAVNRARMAFDRIIAKSRCLRIVNAMARRGDFKAPMESLGLPKVCFIDPFDGKPIRLKQTPEGPFVYSVGEDFKDDGGQFDAAGGKAFDVGFGPPKATKR
jgi:hypothetical protein